MKTIEINNKHYQECDVVMLKSGKNNSKIGLNLNVVTGIHLYYFEQGARWDETQHLYIVSNEEIKEGDWCIDNRPTMNNFIHQLSCNVKGDIKKIIASTNNMQNELSVKGVIGNIPQIPQQFIDQYINEYNKGNIITKVLVEVKLETFHDWLTAPCEPFPDKIKLNQDNEISILIIDKSIIHKFVREIQEEFPEMNHDYLTFKADSFISDNEIYTKEEVKKLFKSCYLDAIFTTSERWNGEYANGIYPDINKVFGKSADDWIEKHLK